MYSYFTTVFFAAVLLLSSEKSVAKDNLANTTPHLYFIENKGQIKDQYSKQRKDIQYSLQGQGMSVFIGNGQLHYQFAKRSQAACEADNSLKGIGQTNGFNREMLERMHLSHRQTVPPNGVISDFETYRMDVELLGANKNSEALSEQKQGYYENYYLPGCPANGVRANTFKKITYKNVYKNIDWVIYISGNSFEHEFIVRPGGDASKIKLKYSGQTSLSLNEDGSITAVTPMGTIRERAPVCYLKDGSTTPSSFRLQDNILSYNLNVSGALVIDPVVEWGTYYGPDSSTTQFYDAVCDKSANLFACGLTWAGNVGTIATIGSYQYAFGGGTDGYMVKFDSSGNRLWATYYGGDDGDWSIGIDYDKRGHIYMVGTTASLVGIATPGCAQPVFGGGAWDGFLVKFDTTGARIWGTYIGGSGTNYNGGVCCDASGHIYVSGVTSDNNNIGTPGSYQPAKAGGYDDYLVQYDSTGAIGWGTYYGGNRDELGGVVCSDGAYVYITGVTSSPSGIASALAHQAALNGSSDVFLAKFDVFGNRRWGTYYGGSSTETTGGLACDVAGNIFMLGATASDTGIATPGGFKPVKSSTIDGFLVKFEPELGLPLWGTYYGGPGDEFTDNSRIVSDDIGNIYITGYTASASGIASPSDAWQGTFGGGAYDGFLAKYSPSGTQLWSTYYGGSGDDQSVACAFDGKNIYICGLTTSADKIATPGSLLDTGGGNAFFYQGFIAKFMDTAMLTLSAGIQQTAHSNISIYPVPNSGTFTLSGTFAGKEGIAHVVITDINGRVVYNNDAAINHGIVSRQITLNNIASGSYFVKVVSDGQVSMLKFVKE